MTYVCTVNTTTLIGKTSIFMRLFIYNNRPVYHIQIHIYSVGVIRVNKQRVVQMDAPKDRNTLKNQITAVWKNVFCNNSETKKITPADF